MIRLVVGLGNPGARYSRNRHNVGFMVIDRLGFELSPGHGGRFAEARFEGREVAFLEPLTFMNRSGEALASAMAALGLGLDEVLVVHDELDLPLGSLKLKRGGGAAGHNGLGSIIERCGGPGFARLRVGIGRPPAGSLPITDWVLGDFSESDGAQLGDVLDDATHALRVAVADGVDVAMNRVNARKDVLKTDDPRSSSRLGPKDREEHMTAAKKLAREYELVYILRPNLGPEEAKKVSDRIVDVVKARGAKLTHVDQWGKRKLAYPIEKHTRGAFVYLRIVGFSDVMAEVERNLRILDGVIRYQTVRLEGLFDLDELEVDPAEIEFREIEGGDEEEEEPSFEERLGMRSREPEPGLAEHVAEDPAIDDDIALADAVEPEPEEPTDTVEEE